MLKFTRRTVAALPGATNMQTEPNYLPTETDYSDEMLSVPDLSDLFALAELRQLAESVESVWLS